MSIGEMFRRIDSLANKECGVGASEDEIAEAERALGVRFPTSYKAFLSTFGWARLFYDALCGLGPSVPRPYALVKTTLSERHVLEPRIPHQLIPVMNDGAGNHYCLDTGDFHGDECPVVFWDHEHQDGPNQLPEQVSSSFDRWVINRIAESPHAADI